MNVCKSDFKRKVGISNSTTIWKYSTKNLQCLKYATHKIV